MSENEHVLNRVTKTKKGVIKVNSDHNVLISNFDIACNTKIKGDRIEMFNLKNTECQKQFKEITSVEDSFSSIFENNEDINTCMKKFIKKLDDSNKKCFKKIRITERPNR